MKHEKTVVLTQVHPAVKSNCKTAVQFFANCHKHKQKKKHYGDDISPYTTQVLWLKCFVQLVLSQLKSFICASPLTQAGLVPGHKITSFSS